jgi:hypothetical protein
METPPQRTHEASSPLPYAHPTTLMRSSLPLPIAMTLIICGTVVMVGPVIASGIGGGSVGPTQDMQLLMYFFAALAGGAMIVFGILKSLRRDT